MSEMFLLRRSSGSYWRTRRTEGETYWKRPLRERTWIKSGISCVEQVTHHPNFQ